MSLSKHLHPSKQSIVWEPTIELDQYEEGFEKFDGSTLDWQFRGNGLESYSGHFNLHLLF